MKKSIRNLAAAAFATAGLSTAVLAGTLGSAEATDPYTPGGGPGANFVSNGSVTFTVDPSGTTATCTDFDLAGSITNPGTPRAHSAVAGTLGSLSASGCTNPQLGAISVVPNGTWNILVTGDPTGTTWPARLSNVSATVDALQADCILTATGSLDGTFNTATQVFTPTTSNLTVDGDPVGSSCAILDILDGDPVAVSGSWTNTPPSGSSGLTLTH
jgi:hypothetical protein